MTATMSGTFQHSIEVTNEWLSDIALRLDGASSQRAYHALRAVLHALRDRLSVDDAASLSAQLPLLIRGLYYEGYRPSGKPLAERKKAEFLAQVRREFPDEDLNVGGATQAVLQVIAKRVSAGEIEKLKGTLPEEIRSLWP